MESINISKRKQKTEMLLDELVFYELDEIAKVIATEIPWRMLVRILNKLRRIRGVSEINTNSIK